MYKVDDIIDYFTHKEIVISINDITIENGENYVSFITKPYTEPEPEGETDGGEDE